MFSLLNIFIYSLSSCMNFNKDGSFKILLFSDLHFDYFNQTCNNLTPEEKKYNCSNKNTTYFMEKIINLEKPNLIVSLGDTTDWETNNTFFSIKLAMNSIINSGIPWITVLGNHDDQGNKNRSELIPYYNSLPNFLHIDEIENIHGYGNHFIDISNSFRLWFFDSGDHASYESISLNYDWIRKSQINWFTKNKYDNNSLAFFHIPLKEYNNALINKSIIVGDHQETISSSYINGGLFSSLVENNVKASFCGHDHINDFCILYYNIWLCYNGGSGYHGYGIDGWKRRTRVIEIKDYGKNILTWKRLYDKNLTKKDLQLI